MRHEIHLASDDTGEFLLSGVLAPAITPFRQDLSVDPERFARHARWLLESGCAALAAFGTNSEANSLAGEERMALLEFLVEHGVPGEALMPGTGCCSLTDSVRLTAHAVRLGCAGVLMLPPFYYKGVGEEGLFRYFSEVVERLLRRYPGTVAGMKDSSGDWNHSRSVLEAFAGTGFDLFVGSEVFLLANLRHGGVGCISATANVNPAAIRRVYERWREPDADALQEEITATRAVVQKYPMIAALKAIVAHYGADPEWRTVRPPLVPLDEAQREALLAALQARGFAMPGLGGK